MCERPSLDLRRRIVAFIASGHSCRAQADRSDVSPSAAIKLMQLWRRTGSLEPARDWGDWEGRGAAPKSLFGDILNLALTLPMMYRHFASCFVTYWNTYRTLPGISPLGG